MATITLVLARTLHIGSAMLLVALPFFRQFVLMSGNHADAREDRGLFDRWMIRSCWVALMLEAISGAVWFWLIAAQMNDQSSWQVLSPADLKSVLWQTQFGLLWMARAAIGLGLGMTLYFVSNANGFFAFRASFLNRLLLLLSGLLLVTLVWAGHAAAGIHHRALHLIADALHLLLGAIWPMGLFPLGYLLWSRRTTGFIPVDGNIAPLKRFSQISGLAVLILVVTGMVNSWLLIGSWAALFTTFYGGLLLGKIAVVGSMIGLGAFNRFHLLRHTPFEKSTSATLEKIILVESALGLVVLLIVGTMGTTAPPS